MPNFEREKSLLMSQNLFPFLLSVKTQRTCILRWSRQPSLYLRSLYIDKTRRGKKERKSLPRLGLVFFLVFFATTINTVFTDEVMQFALRGQQKEASERYPGLVRGGWSTEIKDQSWGTNYVCTAVHMKPVQSLFILNLQHIARADWRSNSYTQRQDDPPLVS